MKMYRFKDENGTREELDIPAEEAEKAQALNKELVEAAAEYDDAPMELYFEKGTLTQDDIRSGLENRRIPSGGHARILRQCQARHRHQAPDGVHHQRSARPAEGPPPSSRPKERRSGPTKRLRP